eukprot:2053950-Amphidinium_carterae.1
MGWWIGSIVGGSDVWAFHPDGASKSPPNAGWRRPLRRHSPDLTQPHVRKETSLESVNVGITSPGPQSTPKQYETK